MFYIYRITNLVNGKTYIGKHGYEKLDDDYMGSGKILKQAYKKYGIENFKKDILVFNISREEQADILEKTFIKAEREKVGRENCYNITDGGQGVAGMEPWNKGKTNVYNQKTLAKMSEASKGENNPMYGKHLSNEHKKRISENNIGKHSKPKSEDAKKKMSKAKKGKPLSEEHKKKLRGRPAWNKGIEMSEEFRKKCSESHKGQVAWNKGKKMTAEQKNKIEEVREAYRKSGRKDWNTFQKEYKEKTLS